MSKKRSDEVRQSVEQLKDGDPALYKYVRGLEAAVANHAQMASGQRKVAVGSLRLMYWVVLGSTLLQSTKAFTTAVDAWVGGVPHKNGEVRRFPYDEAGRMGAAAFMRFIRVSLVGLLIAVLPTTVLVIQTALMSQQNSYIQKQLDLQARETRLTRRAQLLSVLYDTAEGCRSTPERRCPPRASRRARGEAAHVLAALSREAALRAAQEEGTTSPDAGLSGVDLSRVDLAGVDFSGMALRGASLRDAELTRARFEGAQLQGADLTEARLTGASMARADLRGAKLVEAQLNSADLSGATMIKANMSECDLSKATLKGAKLNEATLDGADLFQADLSGVTFRETSLQKSRLSEANFSDASFVGANLTGAELTGVNLDGATYDKLTVWPAGFDPKKHGASPR